MCLIIDANVLVYKFAAGQNCGKQCCANKKANFLSIFDKLLKEKIGYTKHIFSEYASAFGNDNFRNVWPDWQNNGNVKMVPDTDTIRIFQRLRCLGFSKKDYKYILAACNTKRRYIISEDPDFWDPACKANKHCHQETTKASTSGKVFAILRKNKLTVKNITNATVDFT